MDEKHVKFYCTQIVTALQHMHAQRIIYRGIKPENCVIDDDGYVVLVDLGCVPSYPLMRRVRCQNVYVMWYAGVRPPEVILRNGYGEEKPMCGQ